MDEWKPQSAYQHFYKAVSAGVKHQLTREGKDASLGSLGSTISSKVSNFYLHPFVYY